MLEYGDLTIEQEEATREQILELEKSFQHELLNLRDEFRQEDLDEMRDAANERLKIQEELFAIRLQEMKNAGASEQEIQRETLKFQIEVLKAQIEIAKAFGATTEEIEGYVRQIDLLGAKLDGIVGEDMVDDTEKNLGKIADSWKNLAKEIFDSLSTIADAQVENTSRLVDDLDTRVAETQRALDQEIALQVEGYANNVTAKRNELAELKQARDQATRGREVAIRRQQQLEAISQSVNLFSAVAKTINTYSAIPGVASGS